MYVEVNTFTAVQALVEQPPVHPNDVLREIVDLAQLPVSQEPYDEDAELQFDSELDPNDDADQLEPESSVLVDDDVSPNMTYGQQSFQPAQQTDSALDAQNGGGAGWTDDDFTDAAVDDDNFDTSGFDVAEQS